MRKEARALLIAGCIAALLAVGAIGTATAAIVPFNGTDYSWLHDGPEGDWITQIDDTVEVRPGDAMQFENRWYNGYAGTADIRISYGGNLKYVCAGADQYVLYGLNYCNYYPSGNESVPFYATVTNSSEEPYKILVNHQYVNNGIMHGSGHTWTMSFRRTDLENDTSGTVADPGQDEYASATNMPAVTARPSATGIPAVTVQPTDAGIPASGETPLSTAGFRFDAVMLVSGALAITCLFRGWLRR